jgi:hypothetical protein
MKYMPLRRMTMRRMPMEVVYEDLVRQNIVAHLSQLQLEVFDVVAYGFQSSPWRPKTTI